MVPDHETVKQIMNDVYNEFYLKWRKTLTQKNAGQMMMEAYELEKKYPFDLCTDMLPKLIECIEEEYRRRENIE